MSIIESSTSLSSPVCETCESTNTVCPPRMSDGRIFTDYRPKCDVNHTIDASQKGFDSHNYRMFMMNNATQIMKQNMMKAVEKASCYQQSEDVPIPSSAYKQVCDGNVCTISPTTATNGVGLQK